MNGCGALGEGEGVKSGLGYGEGVLLHEKYAYRHHV
jgi:hypothetical protein